MPNGKGRNPPWRRLANTSSVLFPSRNNPRRENSNEDAAPCKRQTSSWKTNIVLVQSIISPVGVVSTVESKYIEKKSYLSRYTHESTWALRERERPQWPSGFGNEEEWLRSVKQELPRFIPFLTDKCGLEFYGRILEIGAGGAWLSAELSKLPKVVEVITTDFSTKQLKEQAPRIFRLLQANSAKITRMPCDFHKLDFPNKYFDFVVCSAVLHHATNMVQALCEVKRVLKCGGHLVAIREPVWPRVKLKSHSNHLKALSATDTHQRHYTLADYKEVFRQAALPMEVKRVNFSSGLKYLWDEMINGLTHARYAFVARRKGAQ
jgi:ubiquinone/menaquinone biosynthesis C-methylase UbiE